mgnify:CR=1 FL=1
MFLISGLGNPGRQYTNNRHNIGFICIRNLARSNGIRFDKKQGLARIGGGVIFDNKVILARPQTYMNLSGQAIARLASRYKIAPGNIIVIHDDLDLPLGKIRIRSGGGSGGHKGVNSIINNLGYSDFIRIRVGIGRPQSNESYNLSNNNEVIDFVLGDFTENELGIIKQITDIVSQAVGCLILKGLSQAMNEYN